MRLAAPFRTALGVQTLTLDDFDRESFFWRELIDTDQARSVVERFPDRSVWSPAHHECVIVGEWRNRPRIASVVGTTAIRTRRELLRASADRAEELSLEGIILIEWNEHESPHFYASAGLESLDAVIPFELTLRSRVDEWTPSMPLVQLDSRDPEDLRQLVEVDNDAFDWLWINSAREFEHYARGEESELWGHFNGCQLISYAGFTRFGPWGHIDRLAVQPNWQQRGLGRELTLFAVERMRRFGATTIGLSTQASNWKSQRLYSHLGFRRTSVNAYQVYGRRFASR